MQTDFNMVLVTEDERFLASVAHLAILGSLFMGPLCTLVPAYLWYREHQKGAKGSAFLTFHAAQATIYQGLGVTGLTLFAFFTFLLCFIVVGLLLIPVVVILGVGLFVYGVFVGVKVWQGENMKYYIIGDELTRRIPR